MQHYLQCLSVYCAEGRMLHSVNTSSFKTDTHISLDLSMALYMFLVQASQVNNIYKCAQVALNSDALHKYCLI